MTREMSRWNTTRPEAENAKSLLDKYMLQRALPILVYKTRLEAGLFAARARIDLPSIGITFECFATAESQKQSVENCAQNIVKKLEQLRLLEMATTLPRTRGEGAARPVVTIPPPLAGNPSTQLQVWRPPQGPRGPPSRELAVPSRQLAVALPTTTSGLQGARAGRGTGQLAVALPTTPSGLQGARAGRGTGQLAVALPTTPSGLQGARAGRGTVAVSASLDSFHHSLRRTLPAPASLTHMTGGNSSAPCMVEQHSTFTTQMINRTAIAGYPHHGGPPDRATIAQPRWAPDTSQRRIPDTSQRRTPDTSQGRTPDTSQGRRELPQYIRHLFDSKEVLRDCDLLRVSRQIGKFRKTLGLSLGLTSADIENCKFHEEDPYEVNRKILRMWREKQSRRASVGALTRALWDVGAMDALLTFIR